MPDLQRQQLQRLSVTRNLATLLGGTVTVASEPLVGSTFRIVLPRSRPD